MAPPLLGEQRGDEEAGQDEEDVHAEEAAGSPADVAVVEHHGDHRQGAKSVERGPVAKLGAPVPRLRGAATRGPSHRPSILGGWQ